MSVYMLSPTKCASLHNRSACTHHLRVVLRVHSVAVVEEAHGVRALAGTLAKGVHELLELGGALDLEEHLVVVVGDLDVQVLGLLRRLFLLLAGGRGRVFRHGCG